MPCQLLLLLPTKPVGLDLHYVYLLAALYEVRCCNAPCVSRTRQVQQTPFPGCSTQKTFSSLTAIMLQARGQRQGLQHQQQLTTCCAPATRASRRLEVARTAVTDQWVSVQCLTAAHGLAGAS